MRRPDSLALPGLLEPSAVAATAEWIAGVQERSGAIPWFPGGQVDVWDHVECAMALSAAGFRREARRALDWLRRTQRADGSWPLRTRSGMVEDGGADANHCAYLAVGVWHHLLVTGDERFARRMLPSVRRAVDFVIRLQTARGEVLWAMDTRGRPAEFALLAASASIHHSLRCGIELAERLGDAQPDWELAAAQLAHVIADHPEAFADRSRWSMDWYYPVLGGAVRETPADDRLGERWDDFVVPGIGIRCVSDRPWVTGAETCELALTLDAMGEREAAFEQLASMQHLRDDRGEYWTGLEFAQGVRYPVEQTTWTGAAVILAADALTDATAGSAIFRDAAAPATDDEVDLVACGCEPGLDPSADAVADALEHS
jgi:MMP endo-(1,4)-3-O-methyl-alpha-D-mannosidase